MVRLRGLLAGVVAAVLLAMVPGVAGAAGAQPGGRILYLEFGGSTSGGPGAVKSVRPDGTGGQDLGRQLWWYSWPDYSPDGTRIAYAEDFSFRTMAADGTDDRWLVDAPSAPAFPRWSPDGQWVAGESGGDIWRVHRDGPAAGWSNLTGGFDYNDLVPAWAPGGNRFAVATINEIVIYSADGSHVRKVVPLPGAYRLDWRPNGGRIAVEAQGDLWLMDVSSGVVTRLTNTPDVQELSPIWSPDGRWIAFGQGAPVPDEPQQATDPVIRLLDTRTGAVRDTGVHGLPSSWRAAG